MHIMNTVSVHRQSILGSSTLTSEVLIIHNMISLFSNFFFRMADVRKFLLDFSPWQPYELASAQA